MPKQLTDVLRVILADQLCLESSIIRAANKQHDVFLFMEVQEEFEYVGHHVKKIIFLLSAMRHFAQRLEVLGYRVIYVQYDATKNTQTFQTELLSTIKKIKPNKVAFTTPGEYRVRENFLHSLKKHQVIYEEYPDSKFLVSFKTFKAWAVGRKTLQMEFFYRQMRKELNILMDGSKPVGGQWNYDVQNRKKAPKDYQAHPPLQFTPDDITQHLIDNLAPKLSNHIGDAEHFHYAVTRKQALKVLDYFIEHNLNHFGVYQDAMMLDQPWMSHAHISMYLNNGLLHPKECIDKAVQAYIKNNAPINSVEGFVRQILGWREYVRGIYWLHMPDYQSFNALSADNPLPEWFWTGKTKMQCLSQSIHQTIEHAYAHHIQRLMVIGNFCLLAGLDPKAVQAWYLAVYIDAFEWVELPNVQGMILYADDGVMASKPYAASGAYIYKMSNYCSTCHYAVKEKTGERACPFNYLYWYFLYRNREKLSSNHRLALVYKQLDKMDKSQLEEIISSAERFLKK